MAGLHALIESRENIICAHLDDHLAFLYVLFHSRQVCTSDVLSGLNQGMQLRHRSKSSSASQFPPAKEAAGFFRLRDSSPNLRGHRERRGRRVVQECDCRFV